MKSLTPFSQKYDIKMALNIRSILETTNKNEVGEVVYRNGVYIIFLIKSLHKKTNNAVQIRNITIYKDGLLER